MLPIADPPTPVVACIEVSPNTTLPRRILAFASASRSLCPYVFSPSFGASARVNRHTASSRTASREASSSGAKLDEGVTGTVFGGNGIRRGDKGTEGSFLSLVAGRLDAFDFARSSGFDFVRSSALDIGTASRWDEPCAVSATVIGDAKRDWQNQNQSQIGHLFREFKNSQSGWFLPCHAKHTFVAIGLTAQARAPRRVPPPVVKPARRALASGRSLAASEGASRCCHR